MFQKTFRRRDNDVDDWVTWQRFVLLTTGGNHATVMYLSWKLNRYTAVKFLYDSGGKEPFCEKSTERAPTTESLETIWALFSSTPFHLCTSLKQSLDFFGVAP